MIQGNLEFPVSPNISNASGTISNNNNKIIIPKAKPMENSINLVLFLSKKTKAAPIKIKTPNPNVTNKPIVFMTLPSFLFYSTTIKNTCKWNLPLNSRWGCDRIIIEVFVVKKKKKKFWILILIIILLIGCGSLFFLWKTNQLDYKSSLTIQVGEELPTIKDYVKNHKKLDQQTISWKKMKKEKNKIYHAGTYQGTFSYQGKEITLQLIVQDQEAPTIKNVQDLTIHQNEEIDLLKNIEVTDNSHDSIDTKVIGDYDVSKVGTYSLAYQATDKSGNKTEKEFTLTVQEDQNVVGKTSKGYSIKNIDGLYYINDILIANKSYDLPRTYAPGALLEEFNIAFSEMQEAAKQEGININIVSGYRSYNKQTSLYNNYVAKDGKAAADTYSARPGHSEHQTGLAADLNMVDTSFENTDAGKWLANNCYKYGFILRYPKGKESITGYIYEPWHFRFIGDEAKNLYNNGNWITLEEYLGIDSVYE